MFDRLWTISSITGCSTLSNGAIFMHIKNFKVSLLVFMLLSAIAESSIASNWVFVTGNDDVKIFVDMQSLQIHERDVQVWEKRVYVRPKEVKDSSLKNTYNIEVDLSIYHCDEGTSHLLKIDRYANQKGSLLLMESYSYPETPSYKLEIVPDSLGGDVFEYVCDVKKTPNNR
jgi:hypothetical protein